MVVLNNNENSKWKEEADVNKPTNWFVHVGVKSLQSCLSLHDAMDCSP